jgi:hypothetical protein
MRHSNAIIFQLNLLFVAPLAAEDYCATTVIGGLITVAGVLVEVLELLCIRT